MNLQTKQAEIRPHTAAEPDNAHAASESAAFATSEKAQLAHELRTPLAAIHSLADVIAEERFGPVENERYRSYAASMRDAAGHLIEVVEAMLVEGGADHKRRATSADLLVDLGHIARSAHQMLREIAERRAAVLRLDLAAGLPNVLADRTAVTQMVINLASNALRHAGLGAWITFRTGTDADGHVWIEVEDNGPGLPPRIAAAFGAPDAANAAPPSPALASSQGERLGLPLTEALARANGASLTFAAAVPTGTRARITFPPNLQL